MLATINGIALTYLFVYIEKAWNRAIHAPS